MWPITLNLILLGSACLTNAQQQQPEELLEMVRHACEATPGVTYSFDDDHRAGNEQWKISGSARQARSVNVTSIGFTEGLFRFEGTIEQDGKKQAFGLAYDGEKLYVRNPDDSNVTVIEQPTTADLFATVDPRLQMLGMPALSSADPFADEPDRGKTLRAGEILEETTVGTVQCEQLTVRISAKAPDGTQHDMESTWSFGKDDHLPRLHESRLSRFELRDLNVLSAEQSTERSSFKLNEPPTTRSGDK